MTFEVAATLSRRQAYRAGVSADEPVLKKPIGIDLAMPDLGMQIRAAETDQCQASMAVPQCERKNHMRLHCSMSLRWINEELGAVRQFCVRVFGRPLLMACLQQEMRDP
jgi:hypothetical protein